MSAWPTLFLSHGSPMTALEPREAGAFWSRLGTEWVGHFGRPRAVLAFSAHSLARQPLLLAGARHHAVYDFGGFDPRLNTLRYDAPGAPALADEVQGLLAAQGLAAARSDRGGLDHGIWVPLRALLPQADVPVLPLAFPPDASPRALHALGAALAPLADDGVLVIGSGSLTHNLGLVFGGVPPALGAVEIEPCAAFRAWVRDRTGAGDAEALFDYRQRAPHAAYMHPTDEHWLPWYLAWGAAAGSAGAGSGDRPALGLRLHDSLTFGCLAMDAYAFGPQAARLAQALQ